VTRAEPVVLEQSPVSSLEEVAPALLEQFRAARSAVTSGRAVVIEVEGSDLLGQGSVAAAAVASGLLGMARALALEGVEPGWTVNVVARGDGRTLDVEGLTAQGATGQVIRAGNGHLGKVPL